MSSYSVKKSRGRNIKKYKKSRRGHGKRNLKGGKTRRYKVLKNGKRHTLGKRKGRGRGRQMMGGVLTKDMLISSGNTDEVKKYINAKYADNFDAIGIPMAGFSHLTLYHVETTTGILHHFVSVLITNLSKNKIFRKTHKKYALFVYGCFINSNDEHPACFALVRLDLESKVEDKILFIFTNKSEGKTCADTISIPDEYKDNYACFTFKSFISSDGDEYSLVIPRINNDERQGEFLKMLEGIFYHKL